MISLKSKKILITGAGGFIGSHLAEQAIKSGAKVTALVRYVSTGKSGWLDSLSPKIIDNIKIIRGDIRDPDICKLAVEKNDYILNLAAQIAIPYSYVAPRDFLEVNAIGSANMLSAGRDSGIKKFLQVSTSEVYGNAKREPMDEDHPQNPQSPYAASKVAADKMALAFYASFGLPVTIVRPFNTYGPRQSARAIVPTIILQALKSKTVRLGTISTYRDLNYVGDIANGMLSASFSDNTDGETFNLASGESYQIKTIVDTVGEILGKKLMIKSEKRRKRPRKSEVTRLIGDSSKANKVWGYRSSHSLKRGLSKTIAYFEKNIDLYALEDYQI